VALCSLVFMVVGMYWSIRSVKVGDAGLTGVYVYDCWDSSHFPRRADVPTRVSRTVDASVRMSLHCHDWLPHAREN